MHYRYLTSADLDSDRFILLAGAPAYSLYIGDIVTPVEKWTSAALGPVDPAVVAQLEESGFEARFARFLMVRHLGIRFKSMAKASALGRVPN